MKTILLVDDEFPARQMVKSMVDWGKSGFTVMYEAKNGAEALQLYRQHKPDLIISDIQMPVMDGLELLSAIRETDPQQLFIILSCFERFDYARQLVRLGGLDYLIKDTLTPEGLYTALQQAKGRLEPAQKDAGTAGKAVLAQPSACSLALRRWLRGENGEETARQLREAAEEDGRFLLACAKLEGGGRTQPDALAAWLEGLPDIPGWRGRAAGPGGEILLYLSLPKNGGEDDPARKYALLQAVKAVLESGDGNRATLGVSAVHKTADELPAARAESEDALRYRLFLGQGNILYYNPLQNASHAVQHRQLETRIANLRAALAADEMATVNGNLDNLYGANLHGVMHLNYLTYLNSVLWGMLAEERMLRGQIDAPGGDGPKTAADVLRLGSVEEMKNTFSGAFTALSSACRRQSAPEYSQRVRHIIQYIGEHLAEDVSLDVLARHFQTHKTHLARTFKEETGLGVQEFIRQARIEEAKNLLMNSQMRVNEIVYHVGFKNAQNFYTLFTRYVGLTPKAFRDQYG